MPGLHDAKAMIRRVLFALAMLFVPVATWSATLCLTPQEAREWMDSVKHVHIVDLRESRLYQSGTIKGAVNLKLEQLNSMEPEAKANLLLIPGQGFDEHKLPKGYQKIHILGGKPDAWKQAGLKVVKIKIRPAFEIPRGLCEMNDPADKHDAKTIEEDL